jgi:hypothetical protein
MAICTGKTADCVHTPKAEEYRRKAEVAEAMAEAAQDQSAKETYREIAERWHLLAEHAEKNHS